MATKIALSSSTFIEIWRGLDCFDYNLVYLQLKEIIPLFHKIDYIFRLNPFFQLVYWTVRPIALGLGFLRCEEILSEV